MITDDMPESHKRQIQDGRKQSLLRAGIPPKLIDQSLSDLKNGQEIADWLKTGAFERLRAGHNVVIETACIEQVSVLPLIARVLHLNALGCRITTLATMLRAVELRDYDALDPLIEGAALFINGFMEVSKRGAPVPFTPYQRMQVEDVIITRIGAGRATVVQVNNPEKAGYKLADWWNLSTIQALDAETLKVYDK